MRLAFSPRATILDPPWTLLPATSLEPPVWIPASRLRQVERLGWRLGDAWVDPRSVRMREATTLARASDDPRTSRLVD